MDDFAKEATAAVVRVAQSAAVEQVISALTKLAERATHRPITAADLMSVATELLQEARRG